MSRDTNTPWAQFERPKLPPERAENLMEALQPYLQPGTSSDVLRSLITEAFQQAQEADLSAASDFIRRMGGGESHYHDMAAYIDALGKPEEEK